MVQMQSQRLMSAAVLFIPGAEHGHKLEKAFMPTLDVVYSHIQFLRSGVEACRNHYQTRGLGALAISAKVLCRSRR